MTTEPGEAGPAGRIPEAIMNAALDLFYRQGIDGSSVRDIAGRADVSLSSVYAYFESKDALTRAVLIRSHELVNQHVAPMFDEPEKPAFGLLCQALRMHAVRHMLIGPAGIASWINSYSLPKPMRVELHGMQKRYESRFQDLAKQLADDGQIVSANLRLKIRMLLNAGIDTGRWYKPTGPSTVEAVADVYVDLCRSVLKG